MSYDLVMVLERRNGPHRLRDHDDDDDDDVCRLPIPAECSRIEINSTNVMAVVFQRSTDSSTD